MPQSLCRVWLHLIFSTRGRRPFLRQPEFRKAMFGVLARQVMQAGCQSVSVGGYIDHVHLLVGLTRTMKIADLVQAVKTASSAWAKTVIGGSPHFAWQRGYAVYSVSQSQLVAVDEYIRNQEQHHARLSFQEELRILCRKHGVVLDERHAWD